MPKKNSPQQPRDDTSGTSKVSKRLLHVLTIVVSVLVGFSVVLFGFFAYIQITYAGKVFPGIRLGDIELSGLNYEEMQARLEERAADAERKGVTVHAGDIEALVESTIASKSEIDTAFPLYTYTLDGVLDEVMAYGREGNGLKNSWDRLMTFFSPKEFVVFLEFDEERFIGVLQEEFSSLETYPQNAQLLRLEEQFTVQGESVGETFNYESYAEQVRSQLARLETPDITMTLAPAIPDITTSDVASFIPLVQEVYSASPFTLAWEEYTWEFTQAEVGSSLVVALVNGTPTLQFNPELMPEILGHVRTITDIAARDARFQIIDGKVQEFQDSQEGRTLDTQALQKALTAMVQTQAYNEPIQLVVTTQAPEVTESDAADLGITELVAHGTTNFSGSPTNRRKNIANGVRLINGTLIKPGETFSTVNALSPIETSNGFYSELVIKGNRTIPEVGGGLCQVSTTLFRTALNAGAPIVARTNHSYRVSYYEPPVGMDATIYDPAPDFKFTNDYGSYLLLLGYVEGNDITFELWGTKDGRTAESSTPRMYSVTSPGPTKYIETDDLAPGEQKCIERAHNGASADFIYTVTYPNGEVKQETFFSKYKAWQAVCLVGAS